VRDIDDAKELLINHASVEFEQVSFAYDSEREILKDLSFRCEPKQKIAIVGSSGSGKSTIMKLLFRFYDVTSGEILIEGQNIAHVSQQSLRKANSSQ